MYIVLLRQVEVLLKFRTYFLKNQDVVGGTYLARLKMEVLLKFRTYFLKNQDEVGGTYLARLKKKN